MSTALARGSTATHTNFMTNSTAPSVNKLCNLLIRAEMDSDRPACERRLMSAERQAVQGALAVLVRRQSDAKWRPSSEARDALFAARQALAAAHAEAIRVGRMYGVAGLAEVRS